MGRNKIEEQSEAHKEAKDVHFVTLTDFSHLKKMGTAQKYQKYIRREVFSGDMVKDEFGSCAVFMEQRSFATHMSAAEVSDAVALAWMCRTKKRRCVGRHYVKNEDAPT